MSVLVLMSFVLGTSEFMVMGILPDMAEGLGTDYVMIGSLVSVYALSYAVFTPVVSGIVGRFDRYRVFVLCSITFVIASVWTMVSWDYVSVAASRVVTAAVSGVLLSVSLTFVSDFADTRTRAKSVAWVYAGFNISSILGVPIGTMVSHLLGWREVFLLVTIMGVIVTLLCSAVLPRRDPLSGRSGGGGLGTMMRDPRVIGGFMVTLLSFAGSYAVFTYINPILTDGAGFDASNVGVGIMLFGVMCLLSNLAAGRLAARGGLRLVRWLMLVHAGVLALLSVLLVCAPAELADLMLAGLMMYFVNSSVQLLLMEVASKEYPSGMTLASSLNPSALNIGVAVGSFSAGLLYDASGIAHIGYLAGAFVLAAAVVATLLCRYCARPGKGTSVT